MAADDESAQARRLARSQAEVRVFRRGEEEAEADYDALYWDHIPLDERPEFVWKLSAELYGIAPTGDSHEPRLSRSVARVVRR